MASEAVVLGVIRGEEQHRIGGVATIAGEAHRDARDALLDQRLDIAAGALAGEPYLDHGRVHLPRHHRVHANALGRVLHGDDLSELDDARLAGRIGDLRGAGPADAGGRCQVDDCAAPLGLHDRQDVLAGQEDAFQVEIDLRVPGFLAHLDRAAGGGTANVVDEHIDAAEAAVAISDHGVNGGIVGDIALRRGEAAAELGDARDGFLHRGEVAVGAEHPRSFLGEEHGGGAAIAPAGADRAGAADDDDDDDDLVLEALGHVSSLA
jgi:hypothetical protein